MNVVNAHLSSNARRTSTFPWGDLLGQRFAESNVLIIHCYMYVFSVVLAADTVVNTGWRAATYQQSSQHLKLAREALVAHNVKYEQFRKARRIEIT